MSHVGYLVAGLALLLAVVLPRALERYAVSAPMVLLTVGLLLGLTPLPEGLGLDPVAERQAVLRLAEVTVLVALMGVGLALDRPLSPRRRETWAAWSPTWRLLGIAMPLCVIGVALLGWGLGLAPAAALLLGAVLAPTDPVLAGDVQVAGPQVVRDGDDGDDEEAHEIDERDDVRFALTSEAGLNDGLAFPFVHAALLLAAAGSVGPWVGRWLAWELVGRVVVGVAVGIVVGRLLARVAFRSGRPTLRLAEQGEPLLAVAALVLAYGLGEVCGGYGFLSVFACGMTLRAAERGHAYHAAMHEVVERLERLLTLAVLLLLGMAMTRGLVAELDWRGVALGVLLVLVVRPLAGLAGLLPGRRPEALSGGLSRHEALAVAFFGVRGVGSVYYLAFATGEHHFTEERWLWATVAFTVALSVFVHGAAATPVLRRLDRRRDAVR